LVVIGLAALAVAAPTSAQIYSWRDANGNLVLSDQPRDDATPHVYDVPKATNVRATNYVPPTRSRQYDALIVDHANRNNVRPDLVRAVIQVESAYNSTAVSPKGAMGLMQLMPATAREFNVGNPFDPRENIRAGVAYLRRLLDRYDNNEELALAAYNAGPGAVDRYGERVPPYRETQHYVSKVREISEVRVGGKTIYKVVEVVNGRQIVKYSNTRPH
jgi:soluble lytic murein transglycosylase-like protein